MLISFLKNGLINVYLNQKESNFYKEARFFFLLFLPSITVKCAVLLLLLNFWAFKEEVLFEPGCLVFDFSFVCNLFFDCFAALTNAFCSLFCGDDKRNCRKTNQIITATPTKIAMFRKKPEGFLIKLVVNPNKAKMRTTLNKIAENRNFKKATSLKA